MQSGTYFDINLGLSYLHENILSQNTDKVEFIDYAATLSLNNSVAFISSAQLYIISSSR